MTILWRKFVYLKFKIVRRFLLVLTLLYVIVDVKIRRGRGIVVFNATFSNISDISWQSVLLVKETGVPVECYHIMLHRVHLT